MTSTSVELEEARSRVKGLLYRLRASGEELGEFGDDLDLLLNATAPREKTEPRSKPVHNLVRPKDPGTSWGAALSLTKEGRRGLYEDILRELGSWRKGLTDEELIYYLPPAKKYSPSGVRTRRSELVEAGWVVDSGVRRATTSGRPAIVWVVAP